MSLIAEIVSKLFAVFLSWISTERQRKENSAAKEELGAAKAVAKGAQEAADRVSLANKTETTVVSEHLTDSTDTAFDREFERNG